MKAAFVAGAIIALCPVVAFGQTSTTKSQAPEAASVKQTVTQTSSTGEVGGPGGAVTSEMLAEQKDPKLMGSPAWWSTHATADGKPLSAEKR